MRTLLISDLMPGFRWVFFFLQKGQIEGKDAGTLWLNPNQGVQHIHVPGVGMKWTFFFRNWDDQFMSPESTDHKFLYNTPYEALTAMFQFSQVWQMIQFKGGSWVPAVEGGDT